MCDRNVLPRINGALPKRARPRAVHIYKINMPRCGRTSLNARQRLRMNAGIIAGKWAAANAEAVRSSFGEATIGWPTLGVGREATRSFSLVVEFKVYSRLGCELL